MSERSEPQLTTLTGSSSLNTSEPPSFPTLFLDNDQGGKIVYEALSKAGLPVTRLKDHFAPSTPDYEWIPVCAQKGWIVITSDKGIETDPQNRESVIEAKAKIVMLDDNNSKAAIWAAAIIVSRFLIRDLIHHQEACIVPLKNHTNELSSGKRVPRRLYQDVLVFRPMEA